MIQSTKAAVMEAIMTQSIPATAKERRLTVESVRRKSRKEAFRDLAAQILSAEQLAVLEAIEDPVELERQLVEAIRRH